MKRNRRPEPLGPVLPPVEPLPTDNLQKIQCRSMQVFDVRFKEVFYNSAPRRHR